MQHNESDAYISFHTPLILGQGHHKHFFEGLPVAGQILDILSSKPKMYNTHTHTKMHSHF